LPRCCVLLIRGLWVRAPRGPQTQVSTVSVSSRGPPRGAWLGWAVPGARERFAAADHVANIIVRNLLNGCRTFTEIRQGAPGNLDGVAGSASRGAGAARSADTHGEPSGRGATYELTVGLALRTVMDAIGRATRTVFVSLSIVWAHARRLRTYREPSRPCTRFRWLVWFDLDRYSGVQPSGV
jgi:hypothetical protein